MTTPPAATPLLRRDGSSVRVLVVDDEPSLTELLSMALRYEGWDVRAATGGLAAVRAAAEFRPDAVVLDVMMPDIDGLEVLRRLRAAGDDVPVLFLTARDAVEDRVAGLTAGGDDYVTKPFSLEEVVARLRGLMRRTGAAVARDDARLVVGDLVLDEDSQEVTRGGTEVSLTATEFELLRFFMRNPRRVLSGTPVPGPARPGPRRLSVAGGRSPGGTDAGVLQLPLGALVAVAGERSDLRTRTVRCRRLVQQFYCCPSRRHHSRGVWQAMCNRYSTSSATGGCSSACAGGGVEQVPITSLVEA